ncbi:MAG: hypothetical protein AAF567_10995 [Actinomycetota bacterium]
MTDANTPSTTGNTEPLAVPGLPEDWDRLATERVVSVVDQVRVKSSGPAIVIARAVVFGLLGAILATVAMIVFLIGLVRVLNIVIPEDVWLVYMILGALFTGLGAFLWSKRPRGAAS